MWCGTIAIVKFMLKSGIFLCLSGIFYVYYFSEVAEKYAHGYTNLVLSQDTTLNRVKFPFFTLCMSPHVKLSVLDKYNMSIQVLDEPNMMEKETLMNLNKTLKDLFMEATFQLNRDFHLYIIHWDYGNEGLKRYKTQLFEGNANYIQVC